MTLTTEQREQVEHLRRLEANEELGTGRQYHFSCVECGTGDWGYAADTARAFIVRHPGHRTWLDIVR